MSDLYKSNIKGKIYKLLFAMRENMKISHDSRMSIKGEQDQRSQKLTPRQPKGNKIRGFKVKTSTQKLKSQYVSLAKQSKN